MENKEKVQKELEFKYLDLDMKENCKTSYVRNSGSIYGNLKSILCPFCSNQIPKNDFINHTKKHEKKSTKCEYCAETIPLSNYKKHVNKQHKS